MALGLARTGRVVTAAALVMSISFAGLIASHVSFMRMFGLGLACGAGGRDARPHDAVARFHARSRPVELVGAAAASADARADRHQ